MDRHNEFVNNSKINASNIKIVFTGSSSIEYWSTTGGEIWNAKYAPLGAVNYGIGGDKTENLLWRIENGEIDNINPKMVVVYCGSNNIPGTPSADVFRGVNATLAEFARRLPESKILYLNFNPRGDRPDTNGTWDKITKVNNQVIQLADNNKLVVFTMFDSFIEYWGQIKEELYQPDKLHFNKAGYEQWDSLWNETFFNMWNGGV